MNVLLPRTSCEPGSLEEKKRRDRDGCQSRFLSVNNKRKENIKKELLEISTSMYITDIGKIYIKREMKDTTYSHHVTSRYYVSRFTRMTYTLKWKAHDFLDQTN